MTGLSGVLYALIWFCAFIADAKIINLADMTKKSTRNFHTKAGCYFFHAERRRDRERSLLQSDTEGMSIEPIALHLPSLSFCMKIQIAELHVLSAEYADQNLLTMRFKPCVTAGYPKFIRRPRRLSATLRYDISCLKYTG